MHFSHTILCVLGFVSLAAADEKCELTDAQDQAISLATVALALSIPECAGLIDFSDTAGDDEPEPTPECQVELVKSIPKACDNVDGLSAKSWVLEATCDGETTSNAGYPTCVPDECSIDDYQKYLSTQISEGGEDNPLDESCTGDLSVTVTPATQAADEKCELTGAQDQAFGVTSLVLILAEPKCADLFDFSDTTGDDDPEPTPECLKAIVPTMTKICDNVDGLSAKSWVLEATCDGETLPNDAPAGLPSCVPDECSIDDYQKYLSTQISEGGEDNPFDESCTGDLSVTVTSSSASTFSRMNIIGSVGVILAGVVALM